MDLKLTDDEIVAACVRLGTPWPLGLRTVELGDRSALTQALLRGQRSLLVRDLATMAPGGELELTAEVAELIGSVIGAELGVVVAIGRVDEPVASALPVVSAFSRPEGVGWTTLTVTPMGVWGLSRQRLDVVSTAVLGVARAAFDGPNTDDVRRELATFAARLAPTGSQVLQITVGRVRQASLAEARLPDAMVTWDEASWGSTFLDEWFGARA